MPFEAYAFDSADPEYYDRFMEAGAEGGVPSTFRTPGYPFVLGVIYWLFGVSPRTAITIQIGWLILICALLPLLGRRLFGRGGFAAGLLAGLLFHRLAPNVGGEILTEALISLALFFVLVAWVVMHRGHATTLPAAALFGLSLAAAVLVKGSLIFLPPLFIGYVALQAFRKKRYSPRVLITTLVAFLLPLAAYSTYATHVSGSFVLLSRQGRSVLLAGNNEIAVETGGWSPQWTEDPRSFFNQELERDPDRSTLSLVASFYARDPILLGKAIPRKLVAMFGTKTVVLIGIALLYGAAAFPTCLVRKPAPPASDRPVDTRPLWWPGGELIESPASRGDRRVRIRAGLAPLHARMSKPLLPKARLGPLVLSRLDRLRSYDHQFRVGGHRHLR